MKNLTRTDIHRKYMEKLKKEANKNDTKEKRVCMAEKPYIKQKEKGEER